MTNSQTVLVTGATGFVGRHCVRILVEQGYKVHAAVRSLDRGPPGCELALVRDMSEQAEWMAALRGIDAVVHLASRVHVMADHTADPLTEFRRVNVAGTRILLEAGVAAGIRHFVFISSIKVNGEVTHGVPFSFGDVPAPQDPYGISKLEAEQEVRNICEAHGMDWTIIRPPLVYGPGVKANFARLVSLVQSGFPMPLGACRNRRAMINVGNLCDLIARSLEFSAGRNTVLLASDGEDLELAELIRLIGRMLKRRVFLVPVPVSVLTAVSALLSKRAEIARLTESLEIDISETCRIMKWEPTISVLDGLKEMFEKDDV